MGFTVFATCLFPEGEGAQSLLNYSSSGKMRVIRLDVTSDKEVAEVKQYVQDNLPAQGRMVFMSSISSYLSAMNGIYAMSKAGMEKFCDSLRLDMMRNGVRVCLIEPGNYVNATNLLPQKSTDDIWNSLSADAKESYSKEYVEKANHFVNLSLSKGSSKSHEVVDAIVDALTSPTPKPRYLVASIAEKISVYLYLWLPTSLFDKILSLVSA
ncbi:dehydrogenase/reductase SDR family member 9-like isoform X2 [Lithobates pipiens]